MYLFLLMAGRTYSLEMARISLAKHHHRWRMLLYVDEIHIRAPIEYDDFHVWLVIFLYTPPLARKRLKLSSNCQRMNETQNNNATKKNIQIILYHWIAVTIPSGYELLWTLRCHGVSFGSGTGTGIGTVSNLPLLQSCSHSSTFDNFLFLPKQT